MAASSEVCPSQLSCQRGSGERSSSSGVCASRLWETNSSLPLTVASSSAWSVPRLGLLVSGVSHARPSANQRRAGVAW